jgi:hypothetical protein
MKNYPGFRSLVRAGGGLLLLGAALTAWGINITLNDGTNSVTCATSGTTTIDANGDINANVGVGATCDLSGGGDPPPPGSSLPPPTGARMPAVPRARPAGSGHRRTPRDGCAELKPPAAGRKAGHSVTWKVSDLDISTP